MVKRSLRSDRVLIIGNGSVKNYLKAIDVITRLYGHVVILGGEKPMKAFKVIALAKKKLNIRVSLYKIKDDDNGRVKSMTVVLKRDVKPVNQLTIN